MRPTVDYSLDEIMEFSELQDRTNEAAEELESSFMKILEKHKLSEKEVLYTLARVADSFIRMHEDFCFDEKNTLDAEAAFNDYFIACRDISNEDDGSITDSKGYSSEKGN